MQLTFTGKNVSWSPAAGDWSVDLEYISNSPGIYQVRILEKFDFSGKFFNWTDKLGRLLILRPFNSVLWKDFGDFFSENFELDDQFSRKALRAQNDYIWSQTSMFVKS